MALTQAHRPRNAPERGVRRPRSERLARSPDPLVVAVRAPSGVPLVAAEKVFQLVLGEFTTSSMVRSRS